jgi:two-component system CheB/CheR fusion protein
MEPHQNPIVGIGASAGGLKPIEQFFAQMPADTGMSFVIVQHLSPDFKSLMDQLLARHTYMPIHKVTDGIEIAPNSIYLIPPGKQLLISDGKLVLHNRSREHGPQFLIDDFFTSLAEQIGDHSVAIVLSGTGSDGSRGVKRVHEAGGLVIVQSLESADFDGMPQAAIDSRVADFVCDPDAMPETIVNYQRQLNRISNSEKTDLEPDASAIDDQDIVRLRGFFRERDNLDFGLYQRTTVIRRLKRRIGMAAVANAAAYLDLIESDEEEARLLFRDLLVEVTSFFRDPSAFAILRNTVIPNLIETTAQHSELRAWVCGCATGEEAYSVAMVIRDCIERAGRADLTFRVFATDVHSGSLEIAGQGVYPAHVLDDLPEEFVHRFFERSGDSCKIKYNLRQSVIFARNDAVSDPSFTKLDLISCRNLLIYLAKETKKKVLSTFHYGLKNNGILFLGHSESVGDLDKEFVEIDRTWKIYRKNGNLGLLDRSHYPISLSQKMDPLEPPRIPRRNRSNVENQLDVAHTYEDLLARHMPPSLLVNEEFELLHSFGDARKLLMLPEGRPTNEVLKLLDTKFKVAVSSAVYRARQEQLPIVFNGVMVPKDENEEVEYRISVDPYRRQNRTLFLITIDQMCEPKPRKQIEENFAETDLTSERIQQMERELSYTRETLQATVEELESSNEELQATNEELVASNEELQSTNEELHSVNEELHTVNEELHTVNSDHREKIGELTLLSRDMDHLLNNANIGTIFLDEHCNVRSYTPAVSTAFDVHEECIGQPVAVIANKLRNPRLTDDLSEVLSTGQSKEVEIEVLDETTVFLQQIQPYRDDDGICGAVITFTDISKLKEAEKLRLSLVTLAAAGEELPDFAYSVSHDLNSPLRHINYYTEVLEETIAGNDIEESKRATKILKDSATKLREMIDGLLVFSRVNTTGRPLEPVNLSIPIETTIAEMQPALEAHNAVVNVQADLPMVIGDSRQLSQCFRYLFENAIKYCDEDSPRVEVSAIVNDSNIDVSVTDNGIGIDRKQRNDVFRIFKRLGFKDDVPGNGLGLAVCRRIISRHGGRIWVDPDWGMDGTRITFSLPRGE